jgi:hypothetical protein
MIRIENTKGGLLYDSYVWILGHRDFVDWKDRDEPRLLWIRGDPGKGKTMLLIGIVKELQKSICASVLLSYFFCQGTDSRLNNATAVLRGLVYQLLIQQRFLISHLREEYDKAGRWLFEDTNAFVALSKTFTKMLDDTRLKRIYLVVDALDECDSGLSQLLDLIRHVSTSYSRVKWLISSRNQPNIKDRLAMKDNRVELSLELNAKSISGAVGVYIDHQISELERTKRYDWKLRDHVKKELYRRANGTFLWVALVCKALGRVGKWDARLWLEQVPSDLNLLYSRMIDQVQSLEGRTPEFCMKVLSASTIVYRPLNLLELETMIDWPGDVSWEQEDLKEIIGLCGSFLTIREDTIYFIHQSAKD